MDERIVVGEGEGLAPIDRDLGGMEGPVFLHNGMRRIGGVGGAGRDKQQDWEQHDLHGNHPEDALSRIGSFAYPAA